MVRPTPTGKRTLRRKQAGFGFLAVLLLIVLIGLALGQAGMLWSTQSRRIKEAELLYVGERYRDAIRSYQESSPGQAKSYPKTLDDLLLDPRHPRMTRHLRKLYRDPVGDTPDWGLITDPVTQEIHGVYSTAPGQPLKTSGFSKKEANFEGAESYAAWRFEAVPPPEEQVPAPTPALPQPQLAPGSPERVMPNPP
jgi:type II secretory pathway pseudopilin PulG